MNTGIPLVGAGLVPAQYTWATTRVAPTSNTWINLLILKTNQQPLSGIFMTMKLTTWLKPPTFEDEDQNRIASVLNALLITVPIGIALFILGNLLIGRQLTPSTYLLFGSLIVVMIMLLFVLRRGHLEAANMVLLSFGWIGLTFQAWRAGGIQGTSFMANVVVILAASLLVGWRGAVFFAVLGIISGWGLAYAENSGLIDPGPHLPTQDALEKTIIISIATILIYLLINNLSKAVTSARLSNEKLQKLSNNLETQVAERTQAAEEARHQAEQAQKVLEDQMWFTAGQAQLSEVMRGRQDPTTLASQVIRRLCQYLDAPVGALFLQTQDMLHLAGAYAFSPTNHHPTQFKVGEGLVGEAALQKRAILLEDAPENYLVVASSLGENETTHLLIQPFLYEDEVVGVIELGNWTPFTPRQQQFLQGVNESMGITFFLRRRNTAVLWQKRPFRKQNISDKLKPCSPNSQTGSNQKHLKTKTKTASLKT